MNEAKSAKFNITISDAAHKLIPDRSEINLFVRYAPMAFKEQPETNLFSLGKLPVVLVIDGNDITILAKDEKEKAVVAH